MKRILPVLLLSMLMVSCYREIILPVGDDLPVPVMNAQMNTGESTHDIRLSLAQKGRVLPLDGADVRVTVNGKTIITAREMPPEEGVSIRFECVYAFDADLRPGDELLVEARKEDYHLSAKVTAPPAVNLSLIDTSTVRITYMGDTSDYLQVKVSFKDLPGDTWYRVIAGMESDFSYLDGEGNPSPEYSGVVVRWLSPETGFDPVISDGGGKTGGMDLGAMLSAGNSYNCFSDRHIRDQECTIRPLFSPYAIRGERYVYENPFSADAWDVLKSMPLRRRLRARLQLRTIDFTQYRYLKALQNLDTYGTEYTFLVEPTTLPSNVEGGLGFVGLDTISEVVFLDEEETFPALDDQLYY